MDFGDKIQQRKNGLKLEKRQNTTKKEFKTKILSKLYGLKLER